MGEKTASQVQDVVVAGSQSSNFLLPKENKPEQRSPQTYNGGPMLRLRPTKQSLQRLLPFLLVCRDRSWRRGWGGCSTHTHTVGVKCYCTSDLCGPPLQLLGVE